MNSSDMANELRRLSDEIAAISKRLQDLQTLAATTYVEIPAERTSAMPLPSPTTTAVYVEVGPTQILREVTPRPQLPNYGIGNWKVSVRPLRRLLFGSYQELNSPVGREHTEHASLVGLVDINGRVHVVKNRSGQCGDMSISMAEFLSLPV